MVTGSFPESTPQDLWINWSDYHRCIEELALLVHASNWKFDQILCLARGGLRPGDVLSRIFDVPLAILSAQSYRLNAGTEQEALQIAPTISIVGGKLGGKILLVDDLVDSGITLQRVQHRLSEDYPAVTEVKSAVIWYKQCSVLKPDYYLHYLPDNPWIHQPFEQYDEIRSDHLSAWLKKGQNKSD
jgi:hypoxanthine phosphoribosyltransferase